MIQTGSAVLSGAKINEDAAVDCVDAATKSAIVVVVDGASGLGNGNRSDCESEAQWLAGGLVDHFAKSFPRLGHLRSEMANATQELRRSNIGQKLKHEVDMPPTAAISIAYLHEGRIDIARLGDCPVLIEFRNGEIDLLPSDQVLTRLDEDVVANLRNLASHLEITPREARKFIKDILVKNRRQANRAGGYWIADLSDVGVRHIKMETYHAHDIRRILIMSDGFRIGVGRNRPFADWRDVLVAVAEVGLPGMLERVKTAMLGDPDWVTYPRMSLCDDLSLAHLTFVEPGQSR